MKIVKKAQYDYEGNGISEENGYTKWYEWSVVKKHVTAIGIALSVLVAIAGMVFKPVLQEYGKKNVVIAALGALAVFLVAVVPLHEMLHLVLPSKGRLDERCLITFGKFTASALFNGFQTRRMHILGLLFPVITLGTVFAAAAIFSEGILRLFFVYLSVMSVYSGYTDIYMAFYSLKHIGRDDVVFGVYKKPKQACQSEQKTK